MIAQSRQALNQGSKRFTPPQTKVNSLEVRVSSLMQRQALESRILLDAAAAGTVVEAAVDSSIVDDHASVASDSGSQGESNTPVRSNDQAAAVINPSEADTPSTESPRELVFIDTGMVKDYQTLLDGIGDRAEVLLLDPNGDGLAQMADYLSKESNLDAIHIISHGSDGNIWLGNLWLTGENATDHSEALGALGSALDADGDLLLYGCGVAADKDGRAFVDALADITEADVAASDDRTGSEALGGDWELEVTSGEVKTATILTEELAQEYNHVLATITVTSSSDSGSGTLRQAISDASSGDTITFSSSVTTVTLSSGQLSIAKNLTIDGDLNNDSSPDVTVDANYTSRVFYISSGTVVLEGLTITHGLLYGDGGDGSKTDGGTGGDALGAGIYNAGTLTIASSTITMNLASGGGGGGGGGGGTYYGMGGGGGGGYNGTGGGKGGSSLANNGAANTGYSGSNGTGGDAGDTNLTDPVNYSWGKGGSTTGGVLSAGYGDRSNGGAGGSASASGIKIGGGGGGYSYGEETSGTGGQGGHAVGGIYNASGATLNIASTTFSKNFGAGGGGGGGKVTAPAGLGQATAANTGSGGYGVGAIWNVSGGTLNYDSSTVTFSNNSGAGGNFWKCCSRSRNAEYLHRWITRNSNGHHLYLHLFKLHHVKHYSHRHLLLRRRQWRRPRLW
ncbi:MAG: DUF4347 domain-containing protein [Magnetococcales bacterium]|nr:DUF4347 domain-containing protein [Magnetococcales bacterium]